MVLMNLHHLTGLGRPMPKKGKGPTPKKTRIKLAVCPEPDSMERSIIVPDPNPRDRGDSIETYNTRAAPSSQSSARRRPAPWSSPVKAVRID